MARNTNNNSVKELWEKSPLSFFVVSMTACVMATAAILIFYFTNRIDDLKFNYEKQIENLNNNHKTEINVIEVKIRQEVQQAISTPIDKNSITGKELEILLKHYSEKK